MTVSEFTYVLQNPSRVTEKQTMEMERVLSEFPFFQAARAIRLKGLYKQQSFRYNLELKKSAAYTTDRAVLFDFISQVNFKTLKQPEFKIDNPENEIIVIDAIVVTGDEVVELTDAQKLEKTIASSIAIAENSSEEVTQAKQNLEIGKPLEFSKSEFYSFDQWLQLSKLKPIERVVEKEKISAEKQEKLALIDKFIESNPKIIPSKTAPVPNVVIDKEPDNTSLMTETLAKVYLEQKKYQKAIQAYEILILKYPEKSVLFADRIKDIKVLQQNN